MMQLEGFSITESCRAAELSRAGFYRHYAEDQPQQAAVELRDAIQKIVVENRFYGYRRVTAVLPHTRCQTCCIDGRHAGGR
jgi:putative transposase